MDADYPHEANENDLAAFLTKFRQWWAKHGLKTLTGLLVACAAIIAVLIMRQRAHRNHEHIWSELATTTTAEVFQAHANKYDEPVARAIANLRGAALFNARATLASRAPAASTVSPDSANNEVERQACLNHAETMLRQVREDPEVPDLLKLNAILILAAVYENRGNFDAAAKMYQEVQTTASEVSSTILHRANRRLRLLEQLRLPVAFGADETSDISLEPGTQSADPNAAIIKGPKPHTGLPNTGGAPSDPDSQLNTSLKP